MARKTPTKEAIEEAASRPLEWFRHDVNAANDMKLELFIDEFGMAGYGRWWRLCELLASETGHKLRIEDERVLRIVARKLNLNAKDCWSLIEILAEIGLVKMPGDGFIYSERMNRQAEQVGRNRVAGSMGGRPRKETAVKTDH